jgi:predicted transcriptional regulator
MHDVPEGRLYGIALPLRLSRGEGFALVHKAEISESAFTQDLRQVEDEPSPSRFRVGLLVMLLVSSGMALPLYALGTVSATPAHMNAVGPRVTENLASGVVGQTGLVVEVTTEKGHFVAADGVMTVSEIEIQVLAPQKIMVENMLASIEGPIAAKVVHDGNHVLLAVGGSAGGRAFKDAVLVLTSGLGPASAGFQGPGMLRGSTGPGEAILSVQPYPATSGLTAAVPKPWSDFSQRRSKFEIYVEILEVMKRGPMTPFEIAFYARLNHKRTKDYTEFLARSGFLQGVTKGGRTVYVVTKEGVGFLEQVKNLFLRTRLIEVASYTYQRDF